MEQIPNINNICACNKTVPTILEGSSLYESMCNLVTITNSMIDEVNKLITAYNNIASEFAKYLPLNGGTMTGNLDMNNNSISNVTTLTTNTAFIKTNLPANAWQGDTSRATNVKYVDDNGINQIDGSNTYFIENYNFFTNINATFDAFLNEHFGLCFIANNLQFEINGQSTKGITCFWYPRYSTPATNSAGWTTLVYDTDKQDYYNIYFNYSFDNKTANITVTPVLSTLPELNYIKNNNGTFTGTLTNGDMTLSESGIEVSNTSDGTISTGFVEGTSNDTVTGMRSTKNLFLYGTGITLNANNGSILVQGTLQNANCTAPTSPNQVANKNYVDKAISAIPTPSGVETSDISTSGWYDGGSFIASISTELDEFLIMNYNKPFILTNNEIEMNGHSSDPYLNMWTPITPPNPATHSWQTITKDAQNNNTYLLRFNYIHSESATLEVYQLNLTT